MPTSLEDRTTHIPPFEQEVKEMSVAAALRKLVDDLFTYETVAEKLQDTAGNERIEVLVSHHKLLLVEHLEETAWRGIDEFLAQLDNLHAQPGLPLSPAPDPRDELDHRIG
jgi:hypothetical protein